jgi:AraC family transcriptional regulator
MDVTLIDRKPARVACHHYTGPYGEPVNQFWRKTVVPWMRENNLIGAARYGVSFDDPLVTPPEKCRYDACIEISEDFVGTGDYDAVTIPGGRYAVTSFEGTAAEIGARWATLLNNWLPGSGLQLDVGPYFEFYGPDSKYDAATGAFSCELCIPIIGP